MPELPEVETLRRELSRAVVGRTIVSVRVIREKSIRPLSVRRFAAALRGRTITSISRQAKILFFDLTAPRRGRSTLAVHLKMTGQLIFTPHAGTMVVGGHPQRNGGVGLPNAYTRVVLKFSDGSTLYFNDLRLFGWLRILDDLERKALTADSGVEPLSKDFTDSTLGEFLKRFPRRSLKKLLLDQHLVAGLGNIYVDEACFRARVRPTRLAGTITRAETARLFTSIVAVLTLSIKNKGTSARNYRRADGTPGGFTKHLAVYGRQGLPCPQCGTSIQKIRHAGRGTHFCPKCQK